uniref:Uncharacterized protein n=1 Tax=Cannabis sativa TaxID=3483 RepID=A0A803QHJ3_CANSA
MFDHEKILHAPTLGKNFSPKCGKPPLSVMDVLATGGALTSDVTSSSTAPSAPLEGFSPVTWQSQMFSLAPPDVPADGNFSSSPDGDGPFSIHSSMISPTHMDADPSVVDVHGLSIPNSNIHPSSMGIDQGPSSYPTVHGEPVSTGVHCS